MIDTGIAVSCRSSAHPAKAETVAAFHV